MRAAPDLPRIRVAAIGMAGVGKSACLNAMVDPEGRSEPFATRASGKSVTQEVVTKEFEVKTDKGDSYVLELTDTMGFPDTTAERIVAKYDEVVRACQAPLHAVVWVVKFDRTQDQEYKNQAVLTREFRLHLEVPIILVINNHQKLGRGRMTQDVQDAKRKEVENDMASFKQQFLEVTGLRIWRCVYAAEMEDLSKVAELLPLISENEPRESPNLRTFADLRDLHTTAVSSEEAARRACAEQEEKVKAAERQVQACKQWLDTVKFGRWTHIFVVSIPFLECAISDCRASLAEAEGARNVAVVELAYMRANSQVAAGKWAEAQEEFRTLCNSLLGHDLGKQFTQ